MTIQDWIPDGIDVEKLKTEERELSERLAVIRRILQAIKGDKRVVARGMYSKKRRPQANTRPAQIVSVLLEAGHPLKVKDIYKKLRERDSTLKWSNPSAVFRGYIKRLEAGPDKVIKTGFGIYGLQQWQDRSPSMLIAPESISPAKSGTKLDMAEHIFREKGALTVEELVRIMKERGAEFRASSPIKSMEAQLGQSSRFARVAPRTFNLADKERRQGEAS